MAFRCYACDRDRPEEKLAKRISGKPICKFCAPYVDERDVGFWMGRETGSKAHRPRKIGRDKNK